MERILSLSRKWNDLESFEAFYTELAALKEAGDEQADRHLTAYRPWGSYTILEEGLFYKIKRITVLPGKKLSYQLHHHRKLSTGSWCGGRRR